MAMSAAKSADKTKPASQGGIPRLASELLGAIIVEKDLVVKDGDYVIFKAPNQWDYEVPVCDLGSAYWVSEWFRHMAEKSWVTKDHLCQFADVVKELNEVK